ncbi:hypothetical protein RIN66_11100 [Hafnia alvei]|nr:hypothetical protein [Hafnia alvei]WNN50658.1 hypothetical protein RIN66_11100 [Hafnia alvei]
MPSAAVKEYLRSNYPDFKESQIEALSKGVASIVIPKEMHKINDGMGLYK